MKIIKIFKNILRNLKFTMSNITKGSVTLSYPDEKREMPNKLRIGTFGLTENKETGEENCIACKLCERICPSNIIDIEIEKRDGRGFAKSFFRNTVVVLFLCSPKLKRQKNKILSFM